jgi:transcription elongation GreA/GreB family factor
MDKPALIRALCAQLEVEIARAIEAATRTAEGATHEEARPENDKDTRALEQSYLARGQAQRVADLKIALKQVQFMDVRAFTHEDAVEVSALVQLEQEEDGETRWYFIAPAGGGNKLQLEAASLSVDVLTPQAPLGRALIGRYVGDEVTLMAGARKREWVISALR